MINEKTKTIKRELKKNCDKCGKYKEIVCINLGSLGNGICRNCERERTAQEHENKAKWYIEQRKVEELKAQTKNQKARYKTNPRYHLKSCIKYNQDILKRIKRLLK